MNGTPLNYKGNKKMPPSNLNKIPEKPPKNILMWIMLLIILFYFIRFNSETMNGMLQKLSYSDFYQMVSNNTSTYSIKNATKIEDIINGELADGTKYMVHIPSNDPDLIRALRNNVDDFKIEPARTFLSNLFFAVLPMLIFIGFLWFFVYRGAVQGGGKIMAFGKSRARKSSDEQKITFNDVAGVDEAKEELQEVIEFLKDPKKFQHLGGKMPKGVLLMGPTGTGKTLLAKAVSGEAGVPFYTISGSDFVEMFVGVGASRVRDLFEQAKKSAKISGKGCIIFIDEIDAVGRQRFAGIGGGHDEREQTLNALLVEMDGFNTEVGIILIAATNRPDVLDPALLRPGRFDRQIVVDKPDIVGREGILQVHAKNIKLAKDVDLKSIARQTSGFSGADLANLVNEAALLAARKDKKAVKKEDMEESIERVMAGPERKSRVISNEEKEIVAAHESGHALLALLTPSVDPLHKISLIPRGAAALGYTMQLPLQDRYITTKKELVGRLIVLLGGRASEEILFDEVSTGAHNDLEISTNLARKMVCDFGMSERLPNMTLGKKHGPVFLGRDIIEENNYSEQTARIIDEEIKKLIDQTYAHAKQLLIDNKDKLQKLVDSIKEKEVMDGEEVKKLVGIEKQ